MTSGLTLRPYQREAVDALVAALAQPPSRAHIEIPTGCGKTVIAAELAARLEPPRCLVLVHREILADQWLATLSGHLGQPAGVLMGERRSHDCSITVASVQTLSRSEDLSRYLANGAPSVIVIDECHHAAAPSYQKIVSEIPEAKIVGLSATPYRTDGQRLESVVGPLVFARSMQEMARDGWLCPLDRRVVELADLDLRQVRAGKTEGESDYVASALAEELTHDSLVGVLVAETLALIGDRQCLVFCVNVEHAQKVAEAFRKSQSRAEAIWAGRADRAEVLAAWRSGEIQIVTSVGVLTEGFDFPGLAALVIARPTMSPGLYTQMLGRATRPAPGKADALVLDVVGNPAYHDARQVTLELVAGERDLQRLGGGKVPRTRASWLLDPIGRSPWAWMPCCDDRAYLADLGGGFVAAVTPAGSSGLWRPWLITKTQTQSVADRPASLRDCVGMVTAAAKRNGISTSLVKLNALWRRDPPTQNQLALLGRVSPKLVTRPEPIPVEMTMEWLRQHRPEIAVAAESEFRGSFNAAARQIQRHGGGRWTQTKAEKAKLQARKATRLWVDEELRKLALSPEVAGWSKGEVSAEIARQLTEPTLRRLMDRATGSPTSAGKPVHSDGAGHRPGQGAQLADRRLRPGGPHPASLGTGRAAPEADRSEPEGIGQTLVTDAAS